MGQYSDAAKDFLRVIYEKRNGYEAPDAVERLRSSYNKLATLEPVDVEDRRVERLLRDVLVGLSSENEDS